MSGMWYQNPYRRLHKAATLPVRPFGKLARTASEAATDLTPMAAMLGDTLVDAAAPAIEAGATAGLNAASDALLAGAPASAGLSGIGGMIGKGLAAATPVLSKAAAPALKMAGRAAARFGTDALDGAATMMGEYDDNPAMTRGLKARAMGMSSPLADMMGQGAKAGAEAVGLPAPPSPGFAGGKTDGAPVGGLIGKVGGGGMAGLLGLMGGAPAEEPTERTFDSPKMLGPGLDKGFQDAMVAALPDGVGGGKVRAPRPSGGPRPAPTPAAPPAPSRAPATHGDRQLAEQRAGMHAVNQEPRPDYSGDTYHLKGSILEPQILKPRQPAPPPAPKPFDADKLNQLVNQNVAILNHAGSIQRGGGGTQDVSNFLMSPNAWGRETPPEGGIASPLDLVPWGAAGRAARGGARAAADAAEDGMARLLGGRAPQPSPAAAVDNAITEVSGIPSMMPRTTEPTPLGPFTTEVSGLPSMMPRTSAPSRAGTAPATPRARAGNPTDVEGFPSMMPLERDTVMDLGRYAREMPRMPGGDDIPPLLRRPSLADEAMPPLGGDSGMRDLLLGAGVAGATIGTIGGLASTPQSASRPPVVLEPTPERRAPVVPSPQDSAQQMQALARAMKNMTPEQRVEIRKAHPAVTNAEMIWGGFDSYDPAEQQYIIDQTKFYARRR